MVNRQSMDFGIKENADVSLHDCRTRKIQLEDSFLTFSIPDGFYFIKDSGAGENYNAEMCCHLSDLYPESFSVSVFRKTIFGRTVREDWTDRFIPAINSGQQEFEFVDTFRSFHRILFRGYLWRDKRPWWRECEIELYIDEITYRWEEK